MGIISIWGAKRSAKRENRDCDGKRRSQAAIKINWKKIAEEGRLRTFALRLHHASAKHQ